MVAFDCSHSSFSSEKRTKRTHVKANSSPIFSALKAENIRKAFPFLSFFISMSLPTLPLNSMSPTMPSLHSDTGDRFTSDTFKLKYRLSSFFLKVNTPFNSMRLPTTIPSESSPSMMQLTITVLLIPLLAGTTTSTEYVVNGIPSFPLRTTAALLTVPHTLTLHLIIAQILFYSFSIDQDVEPPSILLSLHCLTLTFLLFQDLLIVLRCLLRQHDSIHHSSDAHFLGIIAQVGITQHLRQST